MNGKLAEIRRRRAELLEQAAAQRLAFSQAARRWRTPLHYLDIGRQALRGVLARQPLWLVTVSAFLAGVGWRRAGKWVPSLWTAWTMIRAVRRKSPSTP
jgi:hypothetical protein